MNEMKPYSPDSVSDFACLLPDGRANDDQYWQSFSRQQLLDKVHGQSHILIHGARDRIPTNSHLVFVHDAPPHQMTT
jgi:hypothetical protein